MSVCDIKCFSDGLKFGYIAILDTFSRGKQNAVSYNGTDFGCNFSQITPFELSNLQIKNIRKAKDFSRYIKEMNPNFMVNPVVLGNIIFDIPFIYFNGSVIARWSPVFEKDYNKASFSIISGGLIVEYNYQQDIFISVLDAKRHIPKTNSERLLINTANGVVTRSITKAEPERYIEAEYHLVDRNWVCDRFDIAPIAGYKLR